MFDIFEFSLLLYSAQLQRESQEVELLISEFIAVSGVLNIGTIPV